MVSTEKDKESGIPILLIELEPAAAVRMRELVLSKLDSPLPVVLDGKIILEPIVHEPITGDTIQLAPFNPEGSTALLARLQAPC